MPVITISEGYNPTEKYKGGSVPTRGNIDTQSFPVQSLLWQFLQENIFGKNFQNLEALVEVLQGWPRFAEDSDINPHTGWDKIEISDGKLVVGSNLDPESILAIGIIHST